MNSLKSNHDVPVWQSSFPVSWNDSFQLGYAPMDSIHEQFVSIVARLQIAVDADQALVMDELLDHTREHFEVENKWMHETAFPPRDCHIEQHEAVLTSIIEVRTLIDQGRHDVCRSLAHALADWFPVHATHLDSALAHWMFKRKFNGKPLILHRRSTAEAARISA